MDVSSIEDILRKFETERVVAFLNDMDVRALIHNPVFLGAMGALALLALFMKWRVVLVTILTVTGLAWLISYTLERGTQLGGVGDQSLLVFVGSGAVLMAVIIYLLFIKSD